MATLGPYNPDNSNKTVEFKAEFSQTRSETGYTVTIVVYARRTVYYAGGTDGTLNIMYYIGDTATPVKTSDNQKVIIFGDEGWMRLGSYTHDGTLSETSSQSLVVGFASKRTYSSGPLEWNLSVKSTTLTIPAYATEITNTVAHFATGFENGEGTNAAKDCIWLNTLSFSAKAAESFLLDESFACVIPNGFNLSYFGTESITGTWENYEIGTEVTQKNTDMYFQYFYAPNNYCIEYNLEGGINNPENPSTYNVLYGVTLKAPTREGYEFEGWFIDETDERIYGINEGKNASFDGADDFYSQLSLRTIGDITITAKWKSRIGYKGKIKIGVLYARKSINEQFKPVKQIHSRKTTNDEFSKLI